MFEQRTHSMQSHSTNISNFLLNSQLLIAVKAVTTPHPVIVRHDDEKNYYNPATKSKEVFPAIEDSPSVSLSVVVPAFEEESRCKI